MRNQGEGGVLMSIAEGTGPPGWERGADRTFAPNERCLDDHIRQVACLPGEAAGSEWK